MAALRGLRLYFCHYFFSFPDRLEQRFHVIGVLFLLGENLFHHPFTCGIVVAQVADNLRVGFDRNALGHQSLRESFRQAFPLRRILSGSASACLRG